jgi:hypothetical protein
LSKFSPCETRFELRFTSLFNHGRGYAFPCDSQGHVEINDLSERSRCNYFYARTVKGREFSAPIVTVVEQASESLLNRTGFRGGRLA